ncbi:MAG: hypothetical protein EOS58_31760 [Mesorhizobium sp.]|uniref:hypothetical protein n=1 Tax=Mesorhizobium sp. M00.F.Ca.ET.217.01.1.1 TaxID=2500529 RepID=UPI000FD94D3B|nr:hypothetical protein [Mesorhizobium sp. M00.F.Ca.ET.217.01.1.1]RWC99751.1 MAG: hypothetical protein EOS58_31760 [Mesorhizobium sp.]TGQ19068.1 hypothetical protein EN860_021600 [Mesorhizobium sp. M00.F.Ca.ET.217.01.1.1]TGV89956.1 hypothetical protein EN801_019925 [Mesorhizobium sp. M00.F.Ca.ET.158.01.1.1]
MAERGREKLSELYNVPSRFLRSVQLERDFNDPSALEHYVVTPAMASASTRILKGLQVNSAQRAWRITGDYGVGKSSFALMMARILSGQTGADAERIAQTLGFGGKIAERRLLPILVTGAREGLASAIERGVRFGLATDSNGLSKKQRAAVLAALDMQNRKGSAFVVDDLVGAARRAVASIGSGVLLIIDELGKLLEHAAQNPDAEDVFLLQRLAETASRSGDRPFIIVGLLHQGFHAYAERLPAAARHEWDKVAGRFEEIVFDQPLAHTAALIAGALGVGTIPVRIAEEARKAARATGAMGWLGGETAGAANMDASTIYPLHPTLLPPLVRFFARFGQNERSLFGFLLSNEPFGLQSFSDVTPIGEAWYALSDLYDYVRANFGHRLAGHSYQNQWLRIVNTIDANKELPELEVRLLKAVGLLNLLDSDDLLPTTKALVACFSWLPAKSVESALGSLLSGGVIFDRGQRTGFRLWPNTSVNLAAAYQNAARSVGPIEDVSAHLSTLLPAETLLARRHYLERGTMRYFDLRYGTHDVSEATGAGAADGTVLLLLPNSAQEQQAALDRAEQLTLSHDGLVCGVTRPVAFLAPEVQAVRCWEWVRNNTPELAEDGIAAEEVSRQLHEAKRNLTQQFASISAYRRSTAQDVDWFHKGAAIKVGAGLINELSRICDDRFSKAPLVANELINKNAISSAAASARMRLIEGMFRHDRLPLFGIDPTKAPPEKSMYLSIFGKGGIHVDTGSGFELREHPKDDRLRLGPAMDRMVFLIRQGLGGRVSIKDILDDLRLPPYGVRDGLSPLLLATVLKIHGHELAMYESGTFIASFGPLDFLRLIKAPATFEVQYCSVEGVRAEVFSRLADAFVRNVKDRRPVLLDIVTELSQFAAKLPEYTRKSRKLEPTAAAVRDALLTATEPATLMFVSLPHACGLPEFDLATPAPVARAEQFVERLSDAVSNLQTDYTKLLERIVGAVSAALGDETSRFDRDVLARRAAGVSVAAREPRLRAFALRLRDAGLSKDAWAEALASLVVAKPPAKWAPGDEPRFIEEVGALAELFGKVEATAFGSGTSTVSKDAVRVNLTLPDGQDYVHVVTDARLSAREEAQLALMADMLPRGDAKRIQFLANLLFRELAKRTDTEQEATKSLGAAP